MKISIETINAEDQRYPTLGDWYWNNRDELTVKVVKCEDWRAEACLIVHELTEALLCRFNGITNAMVDDWDFSHLNNNNAGNDPMCIYYWQHQFANNAEDNMVRCLGLQQKQYTDMLEKAEKATE